MIPDTPACPACGGHGARDGAVEQVEGIPPYSHRGARPLDRREQERAGRMRQITAGR